jgi:hypothetical protein
VTEPHRKAPDAAEPLIAVCDVLAGLLPPDVEAFTADVRTQWAVEVGLIRIGEAVNRIRYEVLELFSEQPWRQIIAMRNIAATSTTTSTHGECGAPSPATFLSARLTRRHRDPGAQSMSNLEYH